jgi:predicted DNA-binding transcriptional regulator AlpA
MTEPLPRLAYRVNEVCQLLGLGRTTVHQGE